MIELKYKVHRASIIEVEVEATLPDGVVVPAKVTALEAELVSVDQHGTLRLTFPGFAEVPEELVEGRDATLTVS